MACRVGMTTNPGRRKREWEREHPTLRNWTILGRYKTKTKAQQVEKMLAKRHGCVFYPGGDGDENDNWVVYKFDY